MKDGAVLRWTARRLPGVDAEFRADLIEAVDELAARGSRIDRMLETGSLVGFALRSASRRGAFDSGRELVRQGVGVGALVLAVVGALLSWTTADGVRGVAAASAATLTAIAVAGGVRHAAFVLAVGAAVLAVTWGGTGPLAVVVLAAVALGHRFDARPCPTGAAIAAIAIGGGGAAASTLPAPITTAALTAAAIGLSVALFVIGWFDPRYAVAATVVWLWRFVAVDVHELADAFDAFGDRLAVRTLLARWVLMGSAVVAGGLFSRAAIARSTK